MKQSVCGLFLTALFLFAGGGTAVGAAAAESAETARARTLPPDKAESAAAKGQTENKETMLRLTVGDTELNVRWEDNPAVAALRQRAQAAPLVIKMAKYGGFEQVGPLGANLPRDDKPTTTSAGDIVLYSGNQLVIFYGENSWAYTRLGHITGKTAADLKKLLGRGNVTVTISLAPAE